jgi:hypothetical protein
MKLQKPIQMKKLNSIIFFFIVSIGFAQNYKGAIQNIKQNGLHKIVLTPEIRAAANENLDYFRIFDKDKKEVPYVVIYNSEEETSKYISFDVVSKEIIKDSVTSIVVENKTGLKIDQLFLSIANTAISKQYSVSGSNDNKEWFGLIDNQILSGLSASKETTVAKVISFPLNNYKYLRINLKDKNSLPINIVSIGKYDNQFLQQEPLEIKDFKYQITQDLKRKVTQITLSANSNNKIDAIAFSINTDYYTRNAKILVKRERKIKKRIEETEEVISNFQLNSKNSSIISLSNFQEKEFIIEIDNLDNQPLEIESIQLLQKPLFIVSELVSKENYIVQIDSSYSKPSYDLANFIEESKNDYALAAISNFEKVAPKNVTTTEKTFWQSALFMWICIVLGGAVIAYFAFGLLKDMKE